MTSSHRPTRSRTWSRFITTVLCASAFAVGAVVLDGCNQDRPSGISAAGTTQSFVPAVGACSTDGTVRACKVSLGITDGYSKCFVGKQDCRNGVWSACENGDVTIASVATSPTGGGLRIQANGMYDAAACTGDPCDPYCRGYDVDAGSLTASLDGGSSGSSGSYNAFGGSPPGFADKEVCQGSRLCDDSTSGKCNGQSHCNMFDSCQADYHCDTTAHACVNNNGSTSFKWPSATCAGVDLTVGPACTDSSGTAGFSVCNRGNTDLAGPASIGIKLINGDTGLDYSLTPTPQCASGVCAKDTPDCTIVTAATGIPKGSCVRVTKSGGSGSLACAAWSGSGNPVAYVNSNLAITECGNAACGANTCTATGTPGCRNNYADVKDRGTSCTSFGLSYTAVTTTQTYTAACNPGEQLKWKALGWDSSIPSDGSIVFTAQARPVLTDGGLGTASPATPGTVATVKASGSTYPQKCLMGGITGCPAPLTTVLGGAAVNYGSVTITATINPSTDKQTTPTLNAFWVSYRCTPNE
jgi:hypothetical protein